MDIRKSPQVVFETAGKVSICVLLFLCFCFPAQAQLLKIPFLGIVCLSGLMALIRSRGKAVTRSVWIWMLLYVAYNLIWSCIGLANSNPGASNYFRLGVIWPAVFFFIIAALNGNWIRWAKAAMWGILAFQIFAVVVLIGYGFQLWPNILESVFPASAIGLHVGYIHVVGHFVGGLAFTAPFAYGCMVLDGKASPRKRILYTAIWFVVVAAIVATSRRILLIVLLACTAAAVVIPLLGKQKDMRLLARSVAGFALTCLFLYSSTVIISTVTTGFLKSNFQEIIQVLQGVHKDNGDGKIQFVDNIVFDPFSPTDSPSTEPSTEPSTAPTEPSTAPTEPSTSTQPSTTPSTKPNEGQNGFQNRVEGMVGELQGESVRGKILSSVWKNWTKSPLIGVGFGASLPEYEAADGIYEMEYVVRLYTTGVIGIACLLGLMLYVGLIPLLHIRKNQEQALNMGPIAMAYLGAVIATISNPYIFSGFDYLMMLFLPLAFINCSQKNARQNGEKH